MAHVSHEPRGALTLLGEVGEEILHALAQAGFEELLFNDGFSLYSPLHFDLR